MFIIITLGSVMLGITVLEIPKNQNQLHRTNLAVLGDVLSSDINNEIEDLRVLSQSPLVWTSLTDSAGRDAYLKPFLESRASVPHGLSAMLVDYRGWTTGDDHLLENCLSTSIRKRFSSLF